MIRPDLTFVRHDVQALQPNEIEAVSRRLDLPNLAAFRAAIDAAQADAGTGTVRRYLRDLVKQSWFEIVSPASGRTLRSGCSLVLSDKAVVFCFPEEPTLLLGVGDLGQGFPICAALLVDRGLMLATAATDWGFSERHLPELAALIQATGWMPGPVVGTLKLIVGDANFAHHARNQLAAIEALLQGERSDGIGLVTTELPFGPLPEIFPELATWTLTGAPNNGLQALNGPGALFAPAGSRAITAPLVRRLLAFAETRQSAQGRAIRAALSAVAGPVLWVSLRTQSPTPTNQHEVLAALGRCFLRAAPDGAIVIDGPPRPEGPRDGDAGLLRRDRGAAEALRAALENGGRAPRVHVAVGLTITDGILLSRQASVYFCHHGTPQHKIGWFRSVPGTMHGNRASLRPDVAAWVAAQSAVAIQPHCLPLDLVADAGASGDYTITDIPAAIAAFFRHAAASRVGIRITEEDMMSSIADTRAVSAPPASPPASPNISTTHAPVSRPPNRHLLTDSRDLVPSGTEYTDFFRFIDAQLRPTSYFEIGTNHGGSVKAFTCSAVCVDPQFLLQSEVVSARRQTHFFQMTSDTFFTEHDLRGIFKSGPDICFLDGMHRSEYLLRDFMNTERLCHPRSVVFMHDCLPVNTRMALRTYEPGDASEGQWQHAWTGDVWKIVPLLLKHRPDLTIFLLDCAPTGLVAVANLDPASTALADEYSSLVNELRDLDLDAYSIRRLWNALPVISSRSLIAHPEDLTLFLNIC